MHHASSAFIPIYALLSLEVGPPSIFPHAREWNERDDLAFNEFL